ncbi:hypothetical protein K4F52_002748 [Lecanicillium sp. MT-2017a]|nr:hypothetical protein K4F52_002748 [Lecanicillium sp. MT-2017a]
MAGDSSVGRAAVHEAGDQRNVPHSQQHTDPKFQEGEKNSHDNLDSKDERSIANRLEAEEKRKEPKDDPETARSKQDPTLPAKFHGNEPSKGAKIDAQIEQEEQEILEQKGK